MNLNLLKLFQKKFAMKIFSLVSFFIFLISLSFTAFFYHHQSKSLTDALIQNNLLLAGVLAYNSRIGVFSESPELLRNPVDGIFQQVETEAVAIYDASGRLLLKRARRGKEGVSNNAEADTAHDRIKAGIIDTLKKSPSPFYRETRNKMEFWSPVMAGAGYQAAESLFIGEPSPRRNDMAIGFVRITIEKSAFDKKLHALLAKSVLIGLAFLILCSAIIYVTVRRATNPLNRLIRRVQALGRGTLGEQVPVETEDEIGKLAAAFNQMSESLLVRQRENQRLEEQLRHSQRMEAIGTLAGGIAHDFNNILGVIMGYAEIVLLTNPEKTDVNRCQEEILLASNRARDLVKQILTFSRQGSQERSPLLMKPIVEETVKMMRSSLPTTIEIRHTIQPGMAPVLSDPTQIHQVLMNLCMNAGHAMQDGGGVLALNLEERELKAGDPELSIELQPGRYQVLTVSDTGHGMDAAVRERIFDPFFTTKGPGKGTGMGLSVVHGIVKNYGGKINCISELGKGTTFEVFFPTVEEQAREQPKQTGAIPRGRERILYVDDEAALVDIGRQMLESLGYSVVGRTSSIEALEAFRAQPDKFDLLITDNTMPNMTGVELAKKVRLIRRVPVILCTGFSEAILEEKGKAVGIAGFLMKPIIRENIARAIRHALKQGGAAGFGEGDAGGIGRP